MTRSTSAPLVASPGSPASGRAVLSDGDPASRVDLVWVDPMTGETLTLDFEASPGLVHSLREAGFELLESPATAGFGGPRAA